MPEAVIVDAVRTPIGRAFKGSLASLRPDETLAHVIDAVLERNPGVDPATVEEVIAGCGQPQGLQANNIARIAVLLSDKLGQQTNGSTISRYCSSGLDAIRVAANHIVAGQGDVYIGAGVEFVSRYNGSQEATHPEDQHDDLKGHNGRPDAYIAMGLTAENVAERYGVTREQQDEYAQRSQERAVAAQLSGFFDREIVPVGVNGTEVTKDDGPRPSSTLEKLATLEPAFRPGRHRHGGQLVPAQRRRGGGDRDERRQGQELGLKPRARIITAATWGNEPEYMGVAPIGAVKKALQRAGMSIGDVDVYELNEAFAAQVIPIAAEVGFDYDKLNPHGGAIALGHPFGMTGTRIMTTLLNDLETLDGTIGLETMCVAGGQGEAMIVERLR